MYSDASTHREEDYLISIIAQKVIPFPPDASEAECREIHKQRIERSRVCGWDGLPVEVLREMVGVPDARME